MAKRKTSNFLPQAYQTEKNKKFLSATLDQLMNSSNLTKVDGYIGRKHSPNYKTGDNYLTSSALRTIYQLEPAIVTKKDSSITSNSNVDSVMSYGDLLYKLQSHGADTTNANNFFNQEFYNWSGFIDFDCLVNYGSYYWLKDGPNSVSVSGGDIKLSGDWNLKYDLAKNQYTVTELEGRNPIIYVQRTGIYNFKTDNNDPIWIQTDPGSLTGTQTLTPTKSSREIFGAGNNGSTDVRFRVPEIDDQSWYDTNLNLLQDVGLVSNLPWNKVQGRTLSDLITIDNGIDDQRVLENKTIIFLQDTNPATDDANWTTSGVDYTQAPYHNTGFTHANGMVSTLDRHGVFRINIVSNKLVLTKIADITYTDKVNIVEGTTYASRQFYKHTDTNLLTIIPVNTAKLDTLYYQHGTDKSAYGIIKIVETADNSITPTDFLGKERYTSPNGVVFTNGLKIKFDTSVTDTTYHNKEYIVEGVGSEIHLVESALTSPEVDLSTKDYIVMTRGAKDKNAWSRGNKWFHKDVITATAKYNKESAVIDDTNRAIRPIVKYDSGLHLYNHGTTGTDIDVIDTTETDALTNAAGGAGYFVDKVSLTAGKKVIFLKDNDLNTRKTIWATTYLDTTGDSTADSLVFEGTSTTVYVGSSVYVNSGDTRKGKTYHWDGTNWIASQEKTKVNQYPLFELYDSNGVNINDTTTYPSSDFLGNSLFTYSKGTGANDTELGFALKYRTFNNIGDILFDNNYVNGTFNYKKATGITAVNTSTTLVKKTSAYNGVSTYTNGWQKGIQNSRQFQQIEHEITTQTAVTGKTFDLGVDPDVSINALPNIFVYVNSKRTTNFTVSLIEGVHTCTINDELNDGDMVIIRFFSSTNSKKGFWTIPKNLESNGQNQKFTNITLGQLQNHISALVDTNKFFTGKLQGSNNLRDLENYKATEGLITQHSSSMVIPMLLNQETELNYIESLKFAGLEYERFKSKFLNSLETMDGLDLSNASETVDLIMENVNANKSSSFPFYTSDMIPYGADAETITYTITDNRDKEYEITSIFDNTVPSNRSILVYLNDTLLYVNTDYTFGTTSATVNLIKTIAINDVLKIVDYNNTLGNYVPPTPTKLGLYPKFKPEIVSDNTYATTQNVIIGHDGSRTIAYGDSRDNIILDLEKRIYNNIKTPYQENVFNINKYIPGRWRTTTNTQADVNSILEDEFLRWSTRHRIPYTENTTFNANTSSTWNYKNFVDKVDKKLLKQGHWKGIFRYYFDTFKPHTNAWEMFGWSEKPSWWETRYGPAPYTSGNEVLWNDVRDGKKYTSVTEYTVDPLYTRADIYKIMPVSENGEIISPIHCISQNSEDLSPSHAWKFGDGAPPEHAWVNSSSYPFSLQHLMSLIRPAEYFSQLFNKSQMYRNTLIDQLVMKSTTQRQTPTDLKTDLSTTRYEGCGNYVADYLRWLNLDVTKNLSDVIKTSDIKLVHKLEGYTDKKLIKVLAEQVSPTSTSNSVYVPDEDYDIHLHKTGPLKIIPYSGVIVQVNASGYTVYGYDLNNPRFIIHNPIKESNTKTHKVGGETVIEYEEYEKETTAISYGHTFETKQDVVNFFFGLQKQLTLNGYDFDNRMEDFGTEKIVANWLMSVKEFIHWTTQGWMSGSVITISPSANRIRCLTPSGVADSLSNTQAQTNVLNQNYEPLRPGSYKMVRSDDEFELYPDPNMGGIYYVNTKIVEYEHILVFNNVTKFNDVIYQPGLGNRQYRLKLVGFKTGGWDGSLTAEGFIYNDGKVPSWVANTDYVRGDIVTFKDVKYTSTINHTSSSKFVYENWSQTDSFKIGLLPNFDTLGKNFESFYDINAVNLESVTDKYGKGSIGYQNRDYFNQIGMDDVSQVKFYQGMLQEKGTRNAVDKLVRSKFDQISSEIKFYEEWAIREAEYGATDINSRVEILLDEEGFKDNPQPITVYNSTQDKSNVDSKTEYTTSQLYKAPAGVTWNWIPTRRTEHDGQVDKIHYDELYPNAGYPKLTDATATLWHSKDANTLTPLLDILEIGSTLWVANDNNNDWDMKYLDTTASEVMNCDGAQDGSTYTWTTTDNHELKVGDIVVLKGYSTERSGAYTILTVPSTTTFTTKGTGQVSTQAGRSIVLKFISIRFKSNTEFAMPTLGWNKGDKFFVDNDGTGKWYVAQKYDEYKEDQSVVALTPSTNEKFGEVICANDSNQWVFVGNKAENKIHMFTPSPVLLTENSVITSTVTGVSEFGASISTGIQEPREIIEDWGTDSVLYKFKGGQTKFEEWHTGNHWIAVGAPGTNSGKGLVTFYYKEASSGNFLAGVLHQPSTLSSSARFGSDVKMSANGLWCVVTAPGDKKVFVYNRKLHHVDDGVTERRVKSFPGDGSTTDFVLDSFWDEAWRPEELYLRVGSNELVANRDYTYNKSTRTITLNTAPAGGTNLNVQYLLGWKLCTTFTGTEVDYGKTINIDGQGRYIIIGSPNSSTSGDDENGPAVTKCGAVDIKSRHWQCFVGDGTTKAFTVDTGVLEDTKVYINGQPRYDVENSTVVWEKSGATITFVTAPEIGDEVAVWTDQWVPLQSLYPAVADRQDSGLLGSSSIVISEDSESIYAGVPLHDSTTENSGLIEIFDRHQELVAGNCTISSEPVGFNSEHILGQSFFINGYKVTATTNGTMDGIIQDINNAKIPGITASKGVKTNGGEKLVITSTNKKLNSIHITPGYTGSLHKDLGLKPWFLGKTIKLQNPITTGHKFGEELKVDRNNNQLVVGCPSGSTTSTTTFDEKTSIFDSRGTRFKANKYFTGSVHIYQKLGAGNETGWFLSDSLHTNNMDKNDRFGSSLAISNNTIYVGMPDNDSTASDGNTVITDSGKFIKYSVTDPVIRLVEKEEPLVDIDRINKVFLYNKDSNKILSYLDYIDPIKGKIPGEAEQNIDYKTSWDPAIYNYSDGTYGVNKDDAYWNGNTFVGKIWWDLSELKFIQYEQGSIDYRKLFWGGLFPGSKLGIYEWVKSSVKPSSYTKGIAKYGDSAYVELQEYNSTTKLLETRYYFWASSLTDINDNKTLSTTGIRNMISDPLTNGQLYVQFNKNNTLSLINCSKYLEANNVVLSVDFDKKVNDKILHTEWDLVQEGNNDVSIPDHLFLKIKDSLAGADDKGNKVPDVELSAGDKYGIKIRPRQSVFMNRFTALKEYITYVNNVVKQYNLADDIDFTLLNSEEPIPTETSSVYDVAVENITELDYVRNLAKPTGYRVLIKTNSNIGGRWSIHVLQEDNTWSQTRTQSYDTKKFWKYIDWYATGYSIDTNIDYTYTDFNKVYENTIADKSIIKILTGTSWGLYIKENDKYTLIGQKNGTIEFSAGLYNYIDFDFGFDSEGYDFNLLDTEPQIETRKIIEAIKQDVLIYDLMYEHNKVMFVLLKFILQEQPFVDWIFKTSFVNIHHNLRALDQFPTYQRDNQEFVKSYINEVKPYHTKIREYVLGYNKLETYQGDATDFDLPSSYDEVTKTFRSPNYEHSHDTATITNSDAYKMWRENYTYSVDSCRLSRWGIGYQTAPTLTFSAPETAGGVTATATCDIVDNHVNVVTMTNKGSGYTTHPTITVDGGSPTFPAILHPVLSNSKTRKIKETLKFDRIRFSSDVKTWTKNTSYTTTDILQHNNEAYTVDENFTSGATFDSNKLTIKDDDTFNNAMDRTMAYYNPTAGQDGVDLGQIFKGIVYPGTKVQGPLFTKDPGFDKGAFDTRSFDNFDVGPDGRLIISDKNIDVRLQSDFDDSQLGLRPEDIIVDGSSRFVDAYSSHAPEEFVPGRVFDSLSINVFTAPSTDSDNDNALGFPIYSINYKGDGSNKVFKFGEDKSGTDQEVAVWSKSTGRVSSSAYTINWADNEITFTTAPAKDEILNLTSFGNTGEQVLVDYEDQTYNNSSTASIRIPFKYSLLENKQNFIVVNGEHTTTGTLSASGNDTIWTPSSPLGANTHVRFMFFDVASSATRTFSKVTVDEYSVTDSTRTFTLSDGTDSFLARTDKIIVELNGTRLRPPVFTYLTNDTSTATYDLSQNADINHATLTKGDTRVYINGVQTTNYSIVAGSDSTIKAIQLDEAPAPSSKIDVAVTKNADYILTDATTLTITGGTWTGTDKVTVTTFNNHNNLKITTETFKGGSSNAITTDIGFDIRGFESVPFDAVTASVVNIAEFSIFRSPTSVAYLWVTKNGVKMIPNQDYKLVGGKLAFADSLQANDITVITQFTEEIIRPAIGFKIFKDLFDKNHYYRLSNKHTTSLAVDLNKADTSVTVNDTRQFWVPDPVKNIPGVIWINGERIEYLEMDTTTNKLTRLRRGTSGTHIPTTHTEGTIVEDIGHRQEIPSAHSKTWYKVSGGNASDGLGLQNANTTQSDFLLEEPTYIKS